MGEQLPGPALLRQRLPLGPAELALVADSRRRVLDILRGRDRRLLLIVGPCSVHDPAEFLDYAAELRVLADQTADRLFLLVRCYIEKSRTGAGWRGLAREPLPAGLLAARSPGVPFAPSGLSEAGLSEAGEGLLQARSVLAATLRLGLPLAIEMVSPFLWPYWIDCVSWVSVGARGVESQSLREAASALPCACGFKNSTDGGTVTAAHAVDFAARPGSCFAVDPESDPPVVQNLRTAGNPCAHLILRGGRDGPNLDSLLGPGSSPLLVDASHGNSGFLPERQARIAMKALELRAAQAGLRGLMLESYLKTGSQELAGDWRSLPQTGRTLQPGLSVTDPCLGLAETRCLIEDIYQRLDN